MQHRYTGFVTAVRQILYVRIGERLVLKVRSRSLQAMLLQPIEWFDQSYNNPHALASQLTSHGARLQAIVTGSVEALVLFVAAMAVSLGVAFWTSPRMGLLLLACMPVLVLSSLFSVHVQLKYEQVLNDKAEHAGQVRWRWINRSKRRKDEEGKRTGGEKAGGRGGVRTAKQTSTD